MKIGTLLSQRAMRHPDRTAVIFGNRTLSFQSLDTRSHRLANALAAEWQGGQIRTPLAGSTRGPGNARLSSSRHCRRLPKKPYPA